MIVQVNRCSAGNIVAQVVVQPGTVSMSISPQPESEQDEFKSWDSESWTRRPILNADVAAFHAGRLLNVFGFHAQQAWLLGFRCQDHGEAMQEAAAAGALKALRAILPTLQARDIACLINAVEAKLRDWSALRRNYEWWWDRNDDVETGLTSRLECCRDLLRYEDDLATTDLRLRIASELPPGQAVLLQLGECFDAGLRPPNIYAYLWNPSLRPRLRENEEFVESEDGSKFISYHDPKTESGGIRGVNSLANCSRDAGDAPPEAGWELELRTLLRRAGAENRMIETFSSSLADLSSENVISIMDELDQQVRAWLDPRLPCWDDEAKILRLGRVVVKNLRKQRVGPQVELFRAFQEAGWHKSIPNPFVDHGKPDTSRLRQTVRDFRKNQKSGLICFTVGDSGNSVFWQLSEAAESSPGEPKAG